MSLKNNKLPSVLSLLKVLQKIKINKVFQGLVLDQ